MFWGETILHINYRVMGLVGDEATVLIVVAERAKHESTAAEVHQDWAGLLFLRGRFVEVAFDSLTGISRRYMDDLIWFRIEMKSGPNETAKERRDHFVVDILQPHYQGEQRKNKRSRIGLDSSEVLAAAQLELQGCTVSWLKNEFRCRERIMSGNR